MSQNSARRSGLAPDLPGFLGKIVNGAHVLARADVEAFVRGAISAAGSLYEYAAASAEAEAIPGRGTLYSIPGPGAARWIVRRLTHGGLLAPLTGDRFLRLGRPRPFNELVVAERLRELGILTPRVAAAVVYPAGPVYRGEVAREEISAALDLAACLFGANRIGGQLRIEALQSAGQLLGTLHRAGVIHPDLNIRNLLVEVIGSAVSTYIIDVEKCKLASRASRRSRRAMLNRFRRSVRKFEALSGDALSGAEWRAFERSYESVR